MPSDITSIRAASESELVGVEHVWLDRQAPERTVRAWRRDVPDPTRVVVRVPVGVEQVSVVISVVPSRVAVEAVVAAVAPDDDAFNVVRVWAHAADMSPSAGAVPNVACLAVSPFLVTADS